MAVADKTGLQNSYFIPFLGWELVARGTDNVVRGLELSAPPLIFKERGGAGDWVNHHGQ